MSLNPSSTDKECEKQFEDFVNSGALKTNIAIAEVDD